MADISAYLKQRDEQKSEQEHNALKKLRHKAAPDKGFHMKKFRSYAVEAEKKVFEGLGVNFHPLKITSETTTQELIDYLQSLPKWQEMNFHWVDTINKFVESRA